MQGLVYLQPVQILQQRAYRESSLLLEVFTRDYGIISVLAKGVRKEKSKMAGLLLPFIHLNMSYLGKGELKILTQIEYVHTFPLEKLALYCGFYVNELLQKFLHKYDPSPVLFQRYQDCLHELTLTDSSVEQTLRYFELDLLQESGYGVELGIDYQSGARVESNLRYEFSPDNGLIAADNGIISGATLQLLAERKPLPVTALPEAKLLSRQMLDWYLQGRNIKSREVLAKIIKYL